MNKSKASIAGTPGDSNITSNVTTSARIIVTDTKLDNNSHSNHNWMSTQMIFLS